MVSFISMFSGIEAASVAFKPLGWKAICFAEIEKFPAAVLAHHYPDVPNVGDMSKHNWAQYRGKVDIVCGGPPCQAFSVAGLRGSLSDQRGNLSLTYMKALHAINPRNAIVENVPGWLSTKDNAFGCFLAGLVGADDALPPPDGKRWSSAGMVSGPKGRAAWRVLDAQYFGLSQRRKRVIVVADFGNGADPAAILFEPESVRRDSPPSRETGQNVTGTIAARPSGGGGLGTDFDLDGGRNQSAVAYGGNRTSGPLDVATAVNAHGGPHGRLDFESETFVVGVTGAISHALKAEGADGSEDGTGRGTPIICFSAKDYGAEVQAVQMVSAVRRLTPRECERLQGFQWQCNPDYPGAWQDESGRFWSPDYTCIPWRGRPADACPDGPRYKALGNSWAVPKFHWLGARIDRALAAQADPLALAIERYRRQRSALLTLAASVPAA